MVWRAGATDRTGGGAVGIPATDRINDLAERSPGSVWRHRSGDGHGGAPETTGDPLMIVNLSVWTSYEHLHAYVYRSAHGHYVRRRYEWFAKIQTPATALWWVNAGHEPTPAEGIARLRHLRTYGATQQAFPVRVRFDPSGRREPRRAGQHRQERL